MWALISVNNFSLTFLERSSDFSLLNSSWRLPWWYLESPDCARRVARTAVLLFIYEFHWFLIQLRRIPVISTCFKIAWVFFCFRNLRIYLIFWSDTVALKHTCSSSNWLQKNSYGFTDFRIRVPDLLLWSKINLNGKEIIKSLKTHFKILNSWKSKKTLLDI